MQTPQIPSFSYAGVDPEGRKEGGSEQELSLGALGKLPCSCVSCRKDWKMGQEFDRNTSCHMVSLACVKFPASVPLYPSRKINVSDLELSLWGSSDDDHSNFGIRCFWWSNLQNRTGQRVWLPGEDEGISNPSSSLPVPILRREEQSFRSKFLSAHKNCDDCMGSRVEGRTCLGNPHTEGLHPNTNPS